MHTPLYLVAGLGKTGHSIARYLKRRQLSFVMFDTRTQPAGLDAFHTEFPDVDIFLSELPEHYFEQLTAIISSPGVDLDQPSMKKAISMGLPLYGDIECLAREVSVPIIAITGTNGKSTVTTLVGEMARAAGLSVAVAGNIGTPVLDLLDDNHVYDLWVLELSSFQLDLTQSLKPIAATILNVTPDHLDRHHTFEAYLSAKRKVYHHAKFSIYNRDDSLTFPQDKVSEQISFGLDAPETGSWGLTIKDSTSYLTYGETPILSVNDLRIKGQHNWLNALAACALARAAGIDLSYLVEVLKRFSGLPHRSQWVRTHLGVEWINDSKGTNIGATMSAISGIGGSMQGKIVLIAGGQGKGADFTQLRDCVEQQVRCVVLMGVDADQMDSALADIVPIKRAASLDEAVNLAAKEAKTGDVVLLSPACASLDMFRDFNHRGEVFTDVVNAL